MSRMPIILLLAGALLTPAGSTDAQTRELTSEKTGHRYVFHTPANAPRSGTLSALRLNLSSNVERIAVAYYTIEAGIHTDENLNRTAHSMPHWSAQGSRGTITYIPRITVTARNRPVEIGSTLVLEYFSQDMADKSDITREMVEHIPLVYTEQGQTIVVDGMGLPLFQAEFQAQRPTGQQRVSQSGKELLGLIISMFDPGGQLILQHYAPQSLARYCGTAMPALTPPPRAPPDTPGPPPGPPPGRTRPPIPRR